MIYLLDRARDGPGLPIADLPKVYFTQADTLGRGAAHKDFVRDIKLVARDGLFDNFISQIVCDQ